MEVVAIKPDGTSGPLLSLRVTIHLTLKVGMRGSNITMIITNVSLTTGVINSPIADFPEEIFEELFERIFKDSVVPKLNATGQEGFPISSFGHAYPIDPYLTSAVGAFKFATNFRYMTETSTTMYNATQPSNSTYPSEAEPIGMTYILKTSPTKSNNSQSSNTTQLGKIASTGTTYKLPQMSTKMYNNSRSTNLRNLQNVASVDTRSTPPASTAKYNSSRSFNLTNLNNSVTRDIRLTSKSNRPTTMNYNTQATDSPTTIGPDDSESYYNEQ
jgi:hypothetical protein